LSGFKSRKDTRSEDRKGQKYCLKVVENSRKTGFQNSFTGALAVAMAAPAAISFGLGNLPIGLGLALVELRFSGILLWRLHEERETA